MLNGILAIGATFMMFVSVTWQGEKEVIFWGFILMSALLIEILERIK